MVNKLLTTIHYSRATGQLTGDPLPQANAYAMTPNTALMDRAYPDAAGAACAPVKLSLTVRPHSCDFCPNFRQN